MKKILLSTVALMGLTVAAGAADLPRRTVAPVAPIVAVPVFTWTGFYVGVNAGYGFGNNDDYNNSYFIPPGSIATQGGVLTTTGTLTINNFRDNEQDGFVGGAQIGYNFQFGAFVAGIEADLQFADLGGSRNDRFAFGSYTFVPTGALGSGFPTNALGVPASVVTNDGGSGLDYFGTVRARLGVAFDRVLVYGTGGFAYGGGGDNNGFCGVAFGCNNDDDTRVGYAVGAGVEYAFTNNLTFKLEGLYVNLGDGNNNNAFATYDSVNNVVYINGNGNRDTEFGLVRVGVNYKF